MAEHKKSIGFEELIAHFEELEDPRSEINRKHPLVSVVVISLMGILGGASGPTGIRMWAGTKQERLAALLPLPNGLPSRDVIRRVLCALKPDAFQQCFATWIASLSAAKLNSENRHVAIDGKTLRGSHDKAKGLGPLHLVSAWASEKGLTLGQVATDQKSNEITAIPELLRLIDLEGTVITIDAMGTQKKIAEQIVTGKGDFILALKGNQETMHQNVIDYVEQHVSNDFADVVHQQLVETEPKPKHGRTESRTYIQFEVPETFAGRKQWKGLKTFGIVVYRRIEGGKEKIDIRYYLSSLVLNILLFSKSVRSHWGIENTCHWSLDVTYGEDGLRTRHRCASENEGWIRRFTLSLLKQHPLKTSLAMKRRKCGWSWDFLLEILGVPKT